MEEEDLSILDSPTFDDSGELPYDHSSLEKQTISLQTYLDSIPYPCEDVRTMQSQLEYIVGKITICAKTKNWVVLATWDTMLQSWLLLRYPMHTSTRAKLARLYYELCLVPGLEPRVIRSWADMLSRLIANKPDQKRKLEASDLQLPWVPLWRVMQKELWPKRRLQEPSRNMINIFLYIAEHCSRYFSPNDIPDMLAAFIPLVTKDVSSSALFVEPSL